jgi:hypothetical protein
VVDFVDPLAKAAAVSGRINTASNVLTSAVKAGSPKFVCYPTVNVSYDVIRFIYFIHPP